MNDCHFSILNMDILSYGNWWIHACNTMILYTEAGEFTAVQNGTLWCCRICNGNIFPFKTDDDHELCLAIINNIKLPLDNNYQNNYSKSKIFDPFEINKNDDSINEYQGELDPDKHFFNQLAHHLSPSSNYYSEESFSKPIWQKGITSEDFSLIHTNIKSVLANLSSLLSYMSDFKLWQWLVSQKHGCVHPYSLLMA